MRVSDPFYILIFVARITNFSILFGIYIHGPCSEGLMVGREAPQTGFITVSELMLIKFFFLVFLGSP